MQHSAGKVRSRSKVGVAAISGDRPAKRLSFRPRPAHALSTRPDDMLFERGVGEEVVGARQMTVRTGVECVDGVWAFVQGDDAVEVRPARARRAQYPGVHAAPFGRPSTPQIRTLPL